MGNDTEQFRAAIGSYNNSKGYKNCGIFFSCKFGWPAPTQTSFLIWTYFMSLCCGIKTSRHNTIEFPRGLLQLCSLWCVALLLIITSGDVHPNPGPNNTIHPITSLNCFVLNAQSLKAIDICAECPEPESYR